MPVYVRLDAEEMQLEFESNRLLGAENLGKRGACLTERQLLRANPFLVSLEGLCGLQAAPTQSFRDEMKFLLSVSRMRRADRLCAGLWADGHNQSEIASALGVSQQTVSRRLRMALGRCYDMTPISFRQFSRRSIYRAPRRRDPSLRERCCVRCGEAFPYRNGVGAFCSQRCRHASGRGRAS
jgi:hypothetical protein